VWQFVVVLGLVRREQGTLRWSVLRDALCSAPRALPVQGGAEAAPGSSCCPWWSASPPRSSCPSFHIPRAATPLTSSVRAGHTLLAGSWGWFAILAALFLFNTVLGEGLLFRGYLLPCMKSVFGRRAWLANGVLVALYHLHGFGSSRRRC
jgi:hypothetical protein